MQLSSQARKAMATGLAASTLLWSAAGILPQIASAEVHSEGCLVLSGGIVWMITGGTRRGYTSAEVFQSWGYNFSQVVTASAEDVALPVGPIMVYADGTLVMGPNDPLVYLVSAGQKRPFTSGSVFLGLGFSFANIQVAPVNTFSDLPTGSNIDSTAIAHPAGVQVISNGAVWWMDNNGRRGFSSGAQFQDYGYKFSHVVQANSYDLALPNLGDVPNRAACTGGGGPTPPPVPPSGPMSVSLASNNPASSTLVEESVGNNLASFQFTGTGTITSVTLERIGVSSNSTLTNVYLFDGATRLTDASSFGADNKATFAASSLFTVNGSRTIQALADIANTVANQTVGVRLVSYTVAGGTPNAVSVSGNLFNIADAALAGVSFGAVTPSTGNIDPGNDLTVWQSTLTVTIRDVWFNRVMFRKIGSINNSDVNNFKLFIDGVQVAASFSLDTNGYVTFVPAAPIKLLQGARTFRVAADVIGGSSRTLSMSLRSKADIGLTDVSFNAGVALSSAVPASSGDLTIASGTFSSVKAGNSPSGTVVKDANDQVLARWTITAFGEPIKVETLNIGVNTSLTDTDVTLRSGRILVNGSQVGSTTNVPAEDFATVTEVGTQFTTNFTIQPGAPATVEFRGDIYDNEGTNDIVNTTTIIAALVSGNLNNATAQNSLTVLDIPATAVDSPVSGNTLTVAVGSMALTMTANYTNQVTSVPQTNYKLASYNLTGNASEDVNVTSIQVDLANVNGATFTSADITNMYVKYGTQTSTIKSTVTGSNSYSVSFTLIKNTVVPIEVYGNIGPSSGITTTHSIQATTTITGTTVGSSTAVTTGPIAGQIIAYGAGTLTTVISGSTPIAAIVYSNQNADVTSVDLVATNDGFTATELVVKFAALPTTLTSVSLKDGGTVLQTKPAAASVTFTGLSIPVASNTTKTLTASVTVGNVGTGAGATGEDVSADFDDIKVLDSQGTESTKTNDVVGTAQYAYKTVPQIDPVALPTTVLSNGNMTLMKFQVQGMGGTVGWKKIVFTFTKTTGPAITDGTATVWDVTANQVVTQTSAAVATGATGDTAGTVTFIAAAEQQVSGTRVYELRADVATSVAGNSISFKINGGTAWAASNIYSTVAGTAAKVVWTDRSINAHSETTADWTNENAMKNVPTTTQTVSR